MSCPGASEPMIGMGRLTQGEARRPPKSCKVRHVGPPIATRQGTSAMVNLSFLMSGKQGPIARRGASAHQARSPVQMPSQGETHRQARQVGPPGGANTSGGTRMDQNWRTAQLPKSCQSSSSRKSRISNPRLSQLSQGLQKLKIINHIKHENQDGKL